MEKNIGIILIVLSIFLGFMVCLDVSYQNGVEDCIKAKNNVNWCKNELAK